MDGCAGLVYHAGLSVCVNRDDRTAVQGERGERLWLLMRVYHNDKTFFMHLSYRDLQKYTNTRAALLRVLALMMCVIAMRRPWQQMSYKAICLENILLFNPIKSIL